MLRLLIVRIKRKPTSKQNTLDLPHSPGVDDGRLRFAALQTGSRGEGSRGPSVFTGKRGTRLSFTAPPRKRRLVLDPRTPSDCRHHFDLPEIIPVRRRGVPFGNGPFWSQPAPAGSKFLPSLCCDSELSSRWRPCVFPPLAAAPDQTCHFCTEPK